MINSWGFWDFMGNMIRSIFVLVQEIHPFGLHLRFPMLQVRQQENKFPFLTGKEKGGEGKRLSKFAEILNCYSASKLIHSHGNTKGKYSICAAKLADSFWNIRIFCGYRWYWTYGVWKSGQHCKSLWNHLIFYFVFPHPQLLSLSYFPSSNIVTYLWQQLHIQLVTSDVICHSERKDSRIQRWP